MAVYEECYSDQPNPSLLKQTATILSKGGLVIFPTDTVYGLGCLSTQKEPLQRLAKIKGVKLEQAPLSFLFSDIRSMANYVAPMNTPIFKMVKRLLPGPYALIMEASVKLPKPFQKRKTIGVRISNHPLLQNLLPLLEAPLVTTSLHDPDKIIDYTTDPELLFERWESQIEMMISDGYGSNVPSTVIDLTQPEFVVIREGAGENPF
ncbi:MAG: L-threonylcarbamoyladenylate synthase [Flavobacteriaceae bacterium]|nr:threonylcarbamoyl-AMP synthase [Flavobacteriia bacterium]